MTRGEPAQARFKTLRDRRAGSTLAVTAAGTAHDTTSPWPADPTMSP